MIFVERRRPAFSAEFVIRAALIWAVVSAIFVATKWHDIATMALPDADDSMRLVQLRDLIAGQGWFDLHQYRLDPPHGVLMHWSRLVDLPLFLVDRALAPLLGPVLAERATLVVVPLLTLGAAILLVARLAWRLIDTQLIGYACMVLALATPVVGQMEPLRIDHHGWQIVSVLAAINALAARDQRFGGWLAGAALALGMTISLELLPVTVLFGAVLALRWLRDAREGALFVHFCQALAASAVAAFLATRGLSDLAGHCDTLSPPYIAGLAMVALGTTLLSLAGPLPRIPLLIGLGLSAFAAAGTVVLIAPGCTAGPFVHLDPLVRTYWYNNVHEGMPVWLQKPPVLAQMVLPPLVGIYGAVGLWRRSAGWLQRFWADYALLLAGSLVLAVLVARASAFACALAAVPLGWQLREWYRRVQTLRRPIARTAMLTGMAAAVMPGMPLLAATALTKVSHPRSVVGAQQICDIPAAVPTLDRMAPATIFTPIDIGPAVLLATDHRVVASAHHRAASALHDVIEGFLANPDQARAIVTRHQARYVLVCPGMIEVDNYRQAAPDGLMATLMRGRSPGWLRPVALPQGSGLMMWEVVDQPGLNSNASPFMQ